MCMMIIGAYFGSYYDVASFRGSDAAKNAEKTKYSKSQASQMIVHFFHKIKEVYDLESPILSEEMKVMMRTTLEELKKQGSKFIHVALPPRPSTSDRKVSKTNQAAAAAAALAHSKTGPEGEKSLTSPRSKGISGMLSPRSASQVAPVKLAPAPSSPGKRSPEESEQRLIGRYKEFLSTLGADKSIQYKADNENVAFISILEGLPFIADAVESDVRYETLIRKLVFHIRENIKIVNNQKRMDSRVSKTSTWIIRAFRTMIENRMGMSIYERDDEGGQEQDEACAPVVNAAQHMWRHGLCVWI